MAEDRFAAEGYKIIQSVEIYGQELIVAENPEADKQFMAWHRSLDQPFGTEDYMIPVFSNDYLEILREFIRIQSVCTDNLDLHRFYHGSPLLEDRPLKENDCVPGGMGDDLKDKVVAIKAEILSQEYRACSHQLTLVTGGFGCSPRARGRAVFGINIYSGTQERWSRDDILGVIDEKTLPRWAREKLAKLREPREKESVVAKIRDAKSVEKTRPPEERSKKPQDKSGPEL